MPWTNLGTIQISSGWKFTETTENEIFRISHLFPSTENNLRAVAAPGFLEEGKPTIFNPKIIFRRDESEIFTFYFPVGISTHSLGFKRLDTLEANWVVQVESWQSESPEEDYQNYLINRFGSQVVNQTINTMTHLDPRLFSGSTTPKSGELNLKAGIPLQVVKENQGRTEINIRSKGHPVTVATAFDEQGKPSVVLEEMPPNYNFCLSSTTTGLYKGEIWVMASEDTKIGFTEYIAE